MAYIGKHEGTTTIGVFRSKKKSYMSKCVYSATNNFSCIFRSTYMNWHQHLTTSLCICVPPPIHLFVHLRNVELTVEELMDALIKIDTVST